MQKQVKGNITFVVLYPGFNVEQNDPEERFLGPDVLKLWLRHFPI